MEVFWLVFQSSYLLFAGALIYFWRTIPYFVKEISYYPTTFLSVVIVIRNEADNILHLLTDLEQQDYPKNLYEVIIIDDDSTDSGPSIIKDFQSSYPLKLMQLSSVAGVSTKKQGITIGVQNSIGKLILSTDGDCRVGKQWLSTFENFYTKSHCKFIVGGVTFKRTPVLFDKMQTVEFASLTGSGAACLRAGFPNMCNGANLAYEKIAFQEVGGYQGFENLPSGDDEFLMHKIFSLYPQQVQFLKSQEAIVLTNPNRTIKSFIHQRKRWAGKWKYYRILNIKVIAVYIFLINASLLTSLCLTISGLFSLPFFFFAFFSKALIDYIFLTVVLHFYKTTNNLFVFLLSTVFYPFYVSFFAITSTKGKYSWKGRKF